MNILFITGIDTDIGKTFTTGLLAKAFQDADCRVITQKIVQTGCQGVAEDVMKHREIMRLPLQSVDEDNTTCPYVFSKPASPHFASQLEDCAIDPEEITQATLKLAQQYDWVLLEGAGGLMVPINDDLLTIDYIARQRYPVVLVTSGRLGSINHTLLSIEALKQRCVYLQAVVYNHWQKDDDYKDNDVDTSTQSFLQQYLQQHYPHTQWIDLPKVDSLTGLEASYTSDNTLMTDTRLASNNTFEKFVKQLLTENS